MKTCYCFITDGKDTANHAFAVSSLRRHVPYAECITLHDGEYTSGLPCEELINVRGEFERVFGSYEPGVTKGVRMLSFARYVIPSLIGGRYDRIVYLDDDAIVVSPRFAEIADTDLSDFDIGACPYIVGRGAGLAGSLAMKTGIKPAESYFHTGVMVMPGSLSDERVMDLANAYREMHYKNLAVPVHDLANWSMRIKELDGRFNEIIPAVDSNACCIHYSGDKKWLMPIIMEGGAEWTFCS